MKGPSQQISFRLSAEYSDELDARAKEMQLEGSRHELCKQIVMASLRDRSGEQTRNMLGEVHDEVQKLREEFWTAVTALLVNAGKVEHEEARDWVMNALMK